MPGRILVDTTPLRDSRDFRLLFTGQLISVVGTQLTVVAIPYQVYSMTHSSLQVGAISLAQLIPFLAGALSAGPVGDSVDKRRIMVWTSAAMVLTSAAMAVNAGLAHPSLVALYVVSSVAAGLMGFSSTARMAAIPGMVERRHLAAAAAMMQIVFQLGVIVGPALSGLLLGIGLPLVYGLDAASFVVAAVTSAMLAPIPPAESAGGLSPWQSTKEGLRYLRSRQALQGVYLIDINAMVFGMPRALFPAMAGSVFGGGTITLGFLYAAPGVGALIGAVTTGWVANLRRQGWAVIVAVVGVGHRHRAVRSGRHALDRARPAGGGGVGRRDLGRPAQHHSPELGPRALPQPHVLHSDGGRPGRPACGRHGVGRGGHADQRGVLGGLGRSRLHRRRGGHRCTHAAVPPSRGGRGRRRARMIRS